MLEVIVERWTNPDGSVDFMWSVWQDGNRIQMSGTYPTSEAADQGLVTAQFNLGILYARIEGKLRSQEKSIRIPQVTDPSDAVSV